jgi:hypothetical protein
MNAKKKMAAISNQTKKNENKNETDCVTVGAGGGEEGIEIHFFEYHWEKLQTCSIGKRWKEMKDKLANQIIIQNQQKYSFWHTLSHTHPSNPTEGIKKKEIFIISGCVTQSDTHTHTLLYV